MRALILMGCASLLAALDQLDLPVAGQWFAPLGDRPVLRLAGAWGVEQEVPVRDQDGTLRRDGGFASGSGRVRRGEADEAWLRVTGVDLRLSGGAALPRTGPLPERLQDVRIGGFWRRVSPGGVVVGLDGGVSSPSDVPYSGSDVLSVNATAFVRLPASGRDGWVLALRYDRSQTLVPGVPLPGVSYQWIRPGLMATIGIPVAMIDWRPVDDWNLTAGYAPIDAGNAAITWSPGTPREAMGPVGGPWAAIAGASISYETWYRADREDEDLRLSFRTARAYLAGEWRPFPGNRLRLAAGRILLREVSEVDAWRDRADNRFRTDPGWYGSLALGIAF